MKITIDITARPPAPTRGQVRVQLRDTSLVDAPAVVLHEVRTSVRSGSAVIASAQFEVVDVPAHVTVWAHVDVDGDGKVSKGDYVTTRSYPVRAGSPGAISVEVVQV